MRHKLLAPLAACAVLAFAGCGDDDDSATPAAPTGPNAEYITEISTLCSDAFSRRALLDDPDPGKTDELAAYLAKVLEIQEDFRARAVKLDVPAALRADQKLALSKEKALAETLASYERAARGGNRRFLELVRKLQKEANPQIEDLNEVFDRMKIDGCKAEKLNRLKG